MGAACCVVARDRNVQHGSSGEILHRNFRHSPTWSFRCDNRIGVAGEETSGGGLSDLGSRNDTMDLKSATDVSAQVSDGGSSLDNYRTSTWCKSPQNQDDTKYLRTFVSGQLISRNGSVEVKSSAESPLVSDAATVKPLSPMHSASSFFLSPQSSKSISFLQPSPSPIQWAQSSSEHQLTQMALDSHNPGWNSPSMNFVSGGLGVPVASNESARGSYGRSSDGWSAYAFSELISASQREQWSFDSDSCCFNHDKLNRTSGRNSGSMSMDFQICGICSKLLTEKSAWSSEKIVSGNELSVVSVLICGHVYHAECLETITSEINKYEPACPVCTFGEKQTLKLSGKMLKAEIDLKARCSKKSRNRVVDTGDTANGAKSPKLSTSSSLKISATKPFLKRHFSFGSRGNKSTSENPSTRKKGLFWAKSYRA